MVIAVSSVSGPVFSASEVYDNGVFINSNNDIINAEKGLRYVEGDEVYKGDWYSSTFKSQGHVSVGTINKEQTNKEFWFRLKNVDTNTIIYSIPQTYLSSGKEFDSGKRSLSSGTNTQAMVWAYDDKTEHKPWGWTGR